MKDYDVEKLRNLNKIAYYKKFVYNYLHNIDKCKRVKADMDITAYLKEAEVIATAGCCIYDEIINEVTDIALLSYSDGVYLWDSRDIYYYEKYGMALNDNFIHYAMNKINKEYCWALEIAENEYFINGKIIQKCPKCGELLVLEEFGNSYEVKCPKGCIILKMRGI